MKKNDLIEKIKEVEITYDYDETYCNLYNTCIDYMNDTQDWDLEYLFEDYYTYDVVEDIAKNELEKGGLMPPFIF